MNLQIKKEDWLYIIKCMIGAVICYWLYEAFPQYPFFWALISVVLVVSPENDKKLAYLRIEGNFLGSAIGLLLFFFPLPTVIILCLGISLTIIIGFILKLHASVRTAVAANIIVLFQEKEAHSWNVALNRVGCVVVGCVVGFLITILFTKLENMWKKKIKGTNKSAK
jgi:uncharacterized membrane protein YgaE (UPF0421/DUF939 family)